MTAPLFYDITPENGWIFSVTSRTVKAASSSKGIPLPERIGKVRVLAETTYLGSRAVEKAVKGIVREKGEEEPFVKVSLFPQTILVGSHRETLAQQKRWIREFLDQAEREGRAFMIGFSLWEGEEMFDTLELIRYVREKSKGQAVCVAGGPSLLKRNPDLEEKLFSAGADIVNIGGADVFSKWLGTLKDTDRFWRDQDGRLRLDIPEGAPFFTALSNYETKSIGDSVDNPLYLNMMSNAAEVFIPGSSCSNSCSFCGLDAKRHRHNSALFSKIPALAQDVQKILLGEGNAAKLPRPVTDIEIDNPNPMQRMGALRAFLKGVDLSKVARISHFVETPALVTEAGLKRHLDYFDDLMTENPNLTLGTAFSFDAVGYWWDNILLGKTLGPKVLDEADFSALYKNFGILLCEINERPWKTRFLPSLFLIRHPEMTPDVYVRKLKLIDMFSRAFSWKKVSARYEGLAPYIGSPLEQELRGHFAPVLHMRENWAPGYGLSGEGLSFWGNQFKQGDLFDCYSVTSLLCREYYFPHLSVLMGEILSQWEGRTLPLQNKNIFYPLDPAKPSARESAIIRGAAENILSSRGPRVAALMDYLVEPVGDVNASNFPESSVPARNMYSVLDWIKRRETYLIKNNKTYADNPFCTHLVDCMGELMERFKPFRPYIDAIDERPRRADSHRRVLARADLYLRSEPA